MPVKRAKSARRERQKLVAVAVLAVCLVAVLMGPEDAVEPQPEGNGAVASAATSAGSARAAKSADSTHSAASPHPAPSANSLQPARSAPPKLPRLDSQKIAAADPFIVAPSKSAGSDAAIPGAVIDEARAAIAARASVRAVYRTSQGSAAIVDDQIIPVKDAKHWIATLRAAD